MQNFWQEEIRGYPHGGQGAVVWVVRRGGDDPAAPLDIIFSWATGLGRSRGLDQRPPLGAILKSMNDGREEIVFKEDGAALWVEPLYEQGRVRGCLGIWFQADPVWRESIFLWGQRLAARLAPVLGQLEPHISRRIAAATQAQGTLFPLPAGLSATGAAVGHRSEKYRKSLPMPRPVNVPGIPGCIGISREMGELGASLRDVARSGVNVLLKGESGSGKEIIAQALHSLSDRNKGPFVGQNCAALPGQVNSK